MKVDFIIIAFWCGGDCGRFEDWSNMFLLDYPYSIAWVNIDSPLRLSVWQAPFCERRWIDCHNWFHYSLFDAVTICLITISRLFYFKIKRQFIFIVIACNLSLMLVLHAETSETKQPFVRVLMVIFLKVSTEFGQSSPANTIYYSVGHMDCHHIMLYIFIQVLLVLWKFKHALLLCWKT